MNKLPFCESEYVYLRKLWDLLDSPHVSMLEILADKIQKDGLPAGYSEVNDFVVDLLDAIAMQDAGQFPDEWYEEA